MVLGLKTSKNPGYPGEEYLSFISHVALNAVILNDLVCVRCL